MKMALWILSLFLALPVSAANNAVHEACKRLCDNESECVRKCVGHAELFELRADFINAVADFTKKTDDRMRALRSGADLEILALCKGTGWSLDNKMICLRSYPTPEVIRNCKRLSPREEEQVHCVRLGKSEADVDACIRIVPGTDRRLECLERGVTAKDAGDCHEQGGDTYEKMKCLEKAELARMDQGKRQQLDVRIHEERRRQRAPASTFQY